MKIPSSESSRSDKRRCDRSTLLLTLVPDGDNNSFGDSGGLVGNFDLPRAEMNNVTNN